MNSKERFKVTIKDRVTGEKTTLYTHSAGYRFQAKYGPCSVDRPEVVHLVLDFPRIKKKVKNG